MIDLNNIPSDFITWATSPKVKDICDLIATVFKVQKVIDFIWKRLLFPRFRRNSKELIEMVTKSLCNFWNHLAFDIFLVCRFPASSLHTIKKQIKMAIKEKLAAKSAKKKASKKTTSKKIAEKKLPVGYAVKKAEAPKTEKQIQNRDVRTELKKCTSH